MPAERQEFKPSGSGRWLAGVMGILALLAVVGLGFALLTDTGPNRSEELISLVFTMTVLAALSGFMLHRAFFAPDRTFILSERGAEGPDGAGGRSFVPWDRMHGLKVRMILHRVEILDVGGEPLLRVADNTPEFGRLIHALLVNGVLPRRRNAIPVRIEPRSDAPLHLRILMIAGGVALMGFAVKVEFLLWVAGAVAAVFALALVMGRTFRVEAIEIRREGIATLKGGNWKVREWGTLEGVGVMVHHAQKGQRFPLLALKPIGDDWTAVTLPFDQWIEFLSGVHSIDPAKIIAPPEGLMYSIKLGTERKFVVRKGLAKLSKWI